MCVVYMLQLVSHQNTVFEQVSQFLSFAIGRKTETNIALSLSARANTHKLTFLSIHSTASMTPLVFIDMYIKAWINFTLHW